MELPAAPYWKRRNRRITAGPAKFYTICFMVLLGALVFFQRPDPGFSTNSNKKKLTITDAGVDVSNPALYRTVDLKGNSATATVMGMAAGYDLSVYKRFVGGLRKTGYKGNIILGLAPDPPQDVLDYLKEKKVIVKIQKYVKCKYKYQGRLDGQTCAHPYDDLKIRWSRFPLQRDWLEDCKSCTGPVLTVDVRDTIFQLDPFGPGSPPIKGLQVFEEVKIQTTQHPMTNDIIKKCKGESDRVDLWWNKTMLCSGSTIGTREAMMKYLEVMLAEMRLWVSTSSSGKCFNGLSGDDQSIHNWLYYTGQLSFANAIPNRMGIVNTVGVEGAKFGAPADKPLPGAPEGSWIGMQYNFTDEKGFLTQFDGTQSRVVHQVDRLGGYFNDIWLPKQDRGHGYDF